MPPLYWTPNKIFSAIKHRIRYKKPLNSKAVYLDNMGLWRAATRRFGNWGNALRAFFEEYPEFKREEIYVLEARNFKLKTGRKSGNTSNTSKKKESQLKLSLKN